MGHYFKTINYDSTKPDYKAMFEGCLQEAERLKYTYFGIQNLRECWGSYKGSENYNKYGCHDNCRSSPDGYGIGYKWSNFVYRKSTLQKNKDGSGFAGK
jgi:hypothetical protein